MLRVGRRTEDRIHQRQAGHDLRIGGVGADVDDRHQVFAGRRELNLAVVAPFGLVVDADHHVLGLARRFSGRTRDECRHGAEQRQRKESFHHGHLVSKGLPRWSADSCFAPLHCIVRCQATVPGAPARVNQSCCPGRDVLTE